MLDNVFREYDIRGRVGSELHVEQAYELARAIAVYIVTKKPTASTVVVGMDGRTHSPHLKQEICRALVDSGLDVVFIGVCPSPVMYFSLHQLPVDAGLMITASHNPKEYNGIKLCLGTEVIWGAQLKEICALFKKRLFLTPARKGVYREHGMVEPYIRWLVEHFKELIGFDMPVIVDCGNGAAGTVLPELVRVMQFSGMQLLYEEVDGTYPHHDPDPVNEKNMRMVQEILATTDTLVGFGLDGDCDRMVAMTKRGYLIPGDKLLGIFSIALAQELPGSAVVFDIKSSAALITLLEEIGCIPCMSPSGHSIIKTKMKEHHAVLGGELSCHFFFHDRYFGYDDGIYAMLRLLELLKKSGKTLEELLRVFPHKISSPEIRIHCADEKKAAIVAAVKAEFLSRSDVQVITIDGARVQASYGWGIVRASNTQPELSLRFESDTEQGLLQIKQDFVKALSAYFDEHFLCAAVGFE